MPIFTVFLSLIIFREKFSLKVMQYSYRLLVIITDRITDKLFQIGYLIFIDDY